MPSGTEVHIGVYDFHERQHAQLLQRRNDLVALLMYLTERRLFFSINHVFSSLTGMREREDFEWFQEYFPAIEARNGHMLPRANAHAARSRQAMAENRDRRKRRACAAVRRTDLHGSSGRARQRRILRGAAQRTGPRRQANLAAFRNSRATFT